MPKARIRNDMRRHRFEHQEMTQQELAGAVGCSRQTIVLLEQERYVPSLALAMKIAKVFGAMVDDLFQLEILLPRLARIIAIAAFDPEGA